jgi:hypothetical protein
VHKQGLALLKAEYASPEDATAKITSGLESFYQAQYPAVWSGQRAQIDQAAKTLAAIYNENVFPYMKVTWGTHPNNIGHNDYPVASAATTAATTRRMGRASPTTAPRSATTWWRWMRRIRSSWRPWESNRL